MMAKQKDDGGPPIHLAPLWIHEADEGAVENDKGELQDVDASFVPSLIHAMTRHL